MLKEYKISKHNSTVCGYPGRDFDWSKFCWDGNEFYLDSCGRKGHPVDRLKAPLPYTDNCLIADNSEYLHVPYAWSEQCTIYRVRPNDTMYAGEIYRGRLIISQKAIQKDGVWYWVLEFKE